jgi:hypothetical protein
MTLEPGPSPSTAMQKEGLRSFIRFALFQMRARNDHHEFEHLCRALARQRITPNLLPATGPVGAGGDQGRDFETFLTYLRGQVRDLGVFLGIADGDTVVFCCTLQTDQVDRKIREDLTMVTSQGTAVDAVVYFTEADVQVATRHRLIEEAATDPGVRLEILDGQAISELLSDRDSFWIAVEYLDIPSQFAPAEAADDPEWYAQARTRWTARTTPATTVGDLVDLTSCIRHATETASRRGDIEMWLERLRPFFADEEDHRLRQRARYETAVARLRGQQDMRPADDLVRAFFTETADGASLAELDAATVLLQYAEGSWLHGTTALSIDEITQFGDQLTAQVTSRLEAEENADRRAELLDLLGRLRMRVNLRAMAAAGTVPGATTGPPPMPDREWRRLIEEGALQLREGLIITDAGGALDAWHRLVKELPNSPLFPVGSFAFNVSLWAPQLVDLPDWSAFTAAFDERVAAAAGREVAARRSLDRANSLRSAGRPLLALSELHQARVRLMSGDTQVSAIVALLDGARIYRDLGLLYAGKHHGLAAGAVASARNDDFDRFSADSLILAAQCDFLAGNWLSFLALLQDAIGAHLQFHEVPEDYEQWDDFAALLHSALIIQRAAELHPNPQVLTVADEYLTEAGVPRQDPNGAPLPTIHPDLTTEQLQQLTADQIGQPTFADAGAERVITFAARGVRWRIRASNTYDEVRAAERLAATAQEVIAALAENDLVLLEATLDLHVTTVAPRGNQPVNEPPKAEPRGDDPARRWAVTLTRDTGPYSVEFQPAFMECVMIVGVILSSVSLLQPEQFASMLDTAASTGGLLDAVAPHIRYDRAYAVLPEEHFDERTRHGLAPAGPPGFGEPLTNEHLGALRGLGPGYSDAEAEEQAANRYEFYKVTLRHTIPRLSKEPSFRETVEHLRAEGWKDWHILLGLGNQVMNYRIALLGEDPTNQEEILRRYRTRVPEDEGAPAIPPEEVTAESLRYHLEASFGATVQGWGLALRAHASISEIEAVLATRYRYWDIDVPHEDPFTVPSS